MIHVDTSSINKMQGDSDYVEKNSVDLPVFDFENDVFLPDVA
jgi:hypothetical protein